ncbi:hypothetical protein BD779DRAFT_1607615 [Infundibulicybe gibba]|nr:hypothetical protein BD779DRAFT_1607615 [Infundibulicybe gibba]
MEALFCIEPSVELHTLIIRALLKQDNVRTVHRWIQNMPTKPGHFAPTLEHYHIFLEACVELTSFKFMRNLMKSSSHYRFSTLMDDMKREGLRHDLSVASLFYDGYSQRGFVAYAEQIAAIYQSRFPDVQSSQQQQRTAWNLSLASIAQTRGIKAAISLFRSLEKDGCQASDGNLKAILRHSRNVDDLRLLESEFNITATPAHWSILISNSIRTGHISNALAIYEETKRSSIQPDAGLVGPIIKSLCRSSLKPPTDGSIDKALELYYDLVQAAPSNYNQHSIGPDVDIYQSLLRGMASQLYHCSSMRRSPTPSEAIEVYKSLHSSLDEKGYAIVLNAFCKLSFDQGTPVPSLPTISGLGLQISVEVYTILLHQLGNLYDQLVTTTRRTHDLLTLDAAVSPDAHVWNQLMDTYQRLGCFGDAYRVWDMMYLSNRFDHISVSIIFDACGYAGAWHIAKRIFSKLEKDGFEFNLHNWNTWLECLCRLGRLNDAVKVVCMEMGRNQNGLPRRRFSRKGNQTTEVFRDSALFAGALGQLPDDLQRP